MQTEAITIETPIRHKKQVKNSDAYHNQLLFWFTFLTAFPCIMLYFNASVYLFPFLMLAFYRQFGYVFRLRNAMSICALLFFIGCIISTIDSYNILNSMSQLAFYLYWPMLVIFLISHRQNIDYEIVAKAIFWGVVCTTIYYFLREPLQLSAIPFFRRLSQNNFAFISNCFAPVAVYYIKIKKGNRAGVITAILLTIAAFLGGSRSGSILVMLGSFLTIYLDKISIKQILAIIPIVLFIGILEFTGILKKVFLVLNSETYDLIYNREETLLRDQSYLIRLALVEKGLVIFKDNPWTGIGITGFVHTKQMGAGNFKNSEYVMFKPIFEKGSPHNSYVLLLAEGGLVEFVPFVGMLLCGILTLLFNFRRLHPFHFALLFGFLAMCIHMYFIAAIANYFGWFLIGLVGTIVPKKEETRRRLRIVNVNQQVVIQ